MAVDRTIPALITVDIRFFLIIPEIFVYIVFKLDCFSSVLCAVFPEKLKYFGIGNVRAVKQHLFSGDYLRLFKMR